jgi:threonine/homoserine/homoserine lactone efflux protein
MTVMHILCFAGSLAVVAAVPGPAVMATIGRVMTHGERGALAFAGGLLLGDLVWLWTASLGLGAAASVVGPMLRWGELAGAVYLVLLAIKMWRSEPSAREVSPSDRHAALSAFLLQLGNPKAVLFYAAIVPTVVPIGELTVVHLSLLSAVVAVVLLAINLVYVACAAQARRGLRSPRALRAIYRVNALVLAGAAIAVALSIP